MVAFADYQEFQKAYQEYLVAVAFPLVVVHPLAYLEGCQVFVGAYLEAFHPQDFHPFLLELVQEFHLAASSVASSSLVEEVEASLETDETSYLEIVVVELVVVDEMVSSALSDTS